MRGFAGFRLPHGTVGGRCRGRSHASSAGNAAVSPASQALHLHSLDALYLSKAARPVIVWSLGIGVPNSCIHLLQGAVGNPLVKAALTSCSMSMLGDCLAQLLSRRPEKQVTLWGKLHSQLLSL